MVKGFVMSIILREYCDIFAAKNLVNSLSGMGGGAKHVKSSNIQIKYRFCWVIAEHTGRRAPL